MLPPVFWGHRQRNGSATGRYRARWQAIARVHLAFPALLLGIPPAPGRQRHRLARRLWILAGLSLLMAVALVLFYARRGPWRTSRSAPAGVIFGEPLFLANVALSVLVFSAMFVSYTYLADILERIAGITPARIGWWLMGFGAVGLFGNWLGGRLVDRSPLRATALFLVLLALGMAASVPWPASRSCSASHWRFGAANTALYPVCQVRVMRSVQHAQALAATSNVAAANAGIGLARYLAERPSRLSAWNESASSQRPSPYSVWRCSPSSRAWRDDADASVLPRARRRAVQPTGIVQQVQVLLAEIQVAPDDRRRMPVRRIEQVDLLLRQGCSGSNSISCPARTAAAAMNGGSSVTSSASRARARRCA